MRDLALLNRARGLLVALSALGAACGLVAGCGSDSTDPSAVPVRFVEAPEVAEAPGNEVPLARMLSARTNVPARLRLDVSSDRAARFTVRFDEHAQNHAVPILGLKPDRLYRVAVTAIADDGRSLAAAVPVELRTPPLPEGFPPLTVLTSEPQEMEPGYTLFPTASRDGSASGSEGSDPWYLVIVDEAGDVVWYVAGRYGAVEKLPNGNLLALRMSGVLEEIDLLGRRVQSWHPDRGVDGPPGSTAVDALAFHHDAFAIRGTSRMLIPAREHRLVDDFPVDERDSTRRETAMVRDEPIIEIDGADGRVIDTWRFLDILKPTRIGYDGADGLPEFANWAHTNAVIHDPRDDSLIASLRSQDAVVKVSRATGELVWILGSHANWQGFEQYLLSPVGTPFVWQYHQHAPEITPDGTLLMFDNGNYKASPFTGEAVLPASANWSRAVEYAIDEQAMTIRQVWEWGLPQSGEQLYAPFVGDADHQSDTGNVLITFGGVCNARGVPVNDLGACETSARIIEVARSDDEHVVFDLKIENPVRGRRGWFSYRSERISSLYQ